MNDYPGQMHNGYTFSLLPVLDKIYKDNKEERIKAKKRHMEYFNITPNIAGFALGISTAMEEENAKNPEFEVIDVLHQGEWVSIVTRRK